MADIDLHAVAEIPTEIAENYSMNSDMISFKYDALFAKRVENFQFSPIYYTTFTEGLTTEWTEQEDRDLLIGTIKYGYQAYDKMRMDPTFSFSKRNWLPIEVAKTMPLEETQNYPLFPGNILFSLAIKSQILLRICLQ